MVELRSLQIHPYTLMVFGIKSSISLEGVRHTTFQHKLHVRELHPFIVL